MLSLLAVARRGLERTRWSARDRGPVVGRMARKVLRPLLSWETLVFFERDLSQFPYRRIDARIPLEIRLASPEDLRMFRSGLGRTEKERERIGVQASRGDLCFIGLTEGRLVHYSWLSTVGGWIPELGVRLVLQAGDTYLYKAFTDPSVRGHRVQSAVGAFMVQYELEHGFKRHFFYVRRGNTPAFSVTRQFGPMAPHWNARRISVAGPGGSLVTGLDRPNGLRWEFPGESRVRKLGRIGYWVSSPRPRPA